MNHNKVGKTSSNTPPGVFDDSCDDTMFLQWILLCRSKMAYYLCQVFLSIVEEQFDKLRIDVSCDTINSESFNIYDIMDDDDNLCPLQIVDSIKFCDADGCLDLTGSIVLLRIGFLTDI